MSATILTVEDDPIVQNLVRTALEKAGYAVLIAGSGKEMFDILELRGGQAVDLVLLDLGLPDGDAMPHIMDLREKTNLPIVVLTARGRQDDRLMALGLGADDYMTKPIDVRELVLRVGNILARNKGEPRPSVSAVVGTTPRATPMPTGRTAKKAKRRIHAGAVVSVLVLASIVGGGVYLGMKSGLHETQIRRPAVATGAETPDAPTETDTVLNVEQSGGIGEGTSINLTDSQTGPSVAPAEPAANGLADSSQTGGDQTGGDQTVTGSSAAIASSPTPTTTTTIVTLPAPEADQPVVAPPPSQTDSSTFASAAPTQASAVTLGYGWVLESKCAPLPDVDWWLQRSHEEMAHYVTRRKDGDWDFYIAGLAEQLSTLYDISARGSAAKTRTGELLEGEALKAYIDIAVTRIEIARCLAKEAAAAKAAGQ